jgi:hypothetical protein
VSLGKTKTKEHVPPPIEHPGLLARVKMGLKTMKPRGVERTEMYRDISGKEEVDHGVVEVRNEGVRVRDGNEEKSMAIESMSDCIDKEDVLEVRRERLERAADLLGKNSARLVTG